MCRSACLIGDYDLNIRHVALSTRRIVQVTVKPAIHLSDMPGSSSISSHSPGPLRRWAPGYLRLRWSYKKRSQFLDMFEFFDRRDSLNQGIDVRAREDWLQ
jgi:hypothetical protein